MFADTCYTSNGRGNAWVLSALLHVAAATVLVQFGGRMLAPRAHTAAATTIFLPSPAAEIRQAAPLPKPRLRPFRLPKLARTDAVQAVRITAPMSPVIVPAPARANAVIPALQTPPSRPFPADFAQQAVAPPAKPVPVVQTGSFHQDSHNEPERKAALTLQPSGFGGASVAESNRSQPGRAAATGIFGGAALVARDVNGPKSSAVASNGGFGSASASSAGAARAPGQVARAGFGDPVAARPELHANRPALPEAAGATPVEIIFRPRPAYTEEARRQRIEGEVLLEVVFSASGEVRVTRIVHGVGHGLNETAVAAARAIRFRPATRHASPVDSAAMVRMSFELAF